MAHQQGEPQAAQAAALVDQHLRLLGAEAQPVHAGVDMDHRVERPVEALGGGAPGVELAEMVEHRREVVLDEVGLGAGQQAVQHVDRVLGQRAAQRDAFLEMGDEELPAALGREPRPDDRGAGAVGVGLEHGGAIDRPAAGAAGIAQAAPVGGDGAEVDREDRAGPARRVVVGGSIGHRPMAYSKAGPPGPSASAARLPNLVNWPSKDSRTMPVGPWRCLATITSALP